MNSDDEIEFDASESEPEIDEVKYQLKMTISFFQSLSRDALAAEMNEAIEEVESVIQVPPGTCRILLHKYKWNKDSLLERFYEKSDTNEFLIDSQVIPKVKKTFDSKNEEAECEICCDLVELTGLACNHRACNNCWTMYIMDKIKDGQSEIECMASDCKLLMEDEKILEYITDKEAITKYRDLVVDSYVEINNLLCWCPNAKCGKAIRVKVNEPQLVVCDCGTQCCFSCTEEYHDPVGCRHLKMWNKKAQEMKDRKHNGEGYGADKETFTWLMSNTRDCPKCLVSIEKNGGCNYMLCKNPKCRFQFCWICMNAWSVHSNAWYKCNSYDEEADKKREASRADLHRFLFYYTRYFNHKRSLDLEQKLRIIVRTKMEELERKQMRWIEVQFLETAVGVLSKCRKTLLLTYIFAYYLKKDNNTAIFEGNQKDLEMATEQLSGFLERDLEQEDLTALRLKVQDKCRYVEHRRKILLDHCSEGYEQDFWEFSE
ncbi:hypothetical protein CRE_09580 [Caenorhabditis remanei]|uniref:RBR-type E3 ubiquitin transferase n=1 Tax=Caenorhabditis remanei TaxID=31234 RepID=E3MIZ0_CAERE|nr:hypothetical protein CRE_09580 [Caenorhabditis remanei]